MTMMSGVGTGHALLVVFAIIVLASSSAQARMYLNQHKYSKLALPDGSSDYFSYASSDNVLHGRFLVKLRPQQSNSIAARSGGKVQSRAKIIVGKMRKQKMAVRVVNEFRGKAWDGFSLQADDVAKALDALDNELQVLTIYPVTWLPAPDSNITELSSDNLTGAYSAQASSAPTNSTTARLQLAGMDRLDGRLVKVGIIDTGVDNTHPALEGKVQYGYDFVGDSFRAGSLPQPKNSSMDCAGHGTHVAGIIAGLFRSATSNFNFTGVAPGVVLGAYKVFGCSGSTTSEMVVAAMDRAAADGMNIINLSIGDEGSWGGAVADAAERLATQNITVVAAVGNAGPSGLFMPTSAANAAPVIAVASVQSYAGAATVNLRVSSGVANIADARYPVKAAYGNVAALTSTVIKPSAVALAAGVVSAAGSNDGCSSDGGSGEFAGTVALLPLGGCPAQAKIASAVRGRAVGVVLYGDDEALGALVSIPTQGSPGSWPSPYSPFGVPVLAVEPATATSMYGAYYRVWSSLPNNRSKPGLTNAPVGVSFPSPPVPRPPSPPSPPSPSASRPPVVAPPGQQPGARNPSQPGTASPSLSARQHQGSDPWPDAPPPPGVPPPYSDTARGPAPPQLPPPPSLQIDVLSTKSSVLAAGAGSVGSYGSPSASPAAGAPKPSSNPGPDKSPATGTPIPGSSTRSSGGGNRRLLAAPGGRVGLAARWLARRRLHQQGAAAGNSAASAAFPTITAITGTPASYFSSWGPSPNLRLKPTVTAPGGAILSTVPLRLSSSGFAYLSGTSQAAPYVTGALALAMEAGRALNVTPAQLEAALVTTSVPLREFTDASTSPQPNLPPASAMRVGAGVVDIAALITNLLDLNLTRMELGSSLAGGARASFVVDVVNRATVPLSFQLLHVGAASVNATNQMVLDPLVGANNSRRMLPYDAPLVAPAVDVSFSSSRVPNLTTLMVPAAGRMRFRINMTLSSWVSPSDLLLYSGYVLLNPLPPSSSDSFFDPAALKAASLQPPLYLPYSGSSQTLDLVPVLMPLLPGGLSDPTGAWVWDEGGKGLLTDSAPPPPDYLDYSDEAAPPAPPAPPASTLTFLLNGPRASLPSIALFVQRQPSQQSITLHRAADNVKLGPITLTQNIRRMGSGMPYIINWRGTYFDLASRRESSVPRGDFYFLVRLNRPTALNEDPNSAGCDIWKSPVFSMRFGQW